MNPKNTEASKKWKSENMDLMKLPDILKKGKLIEKGDTSIKILTPMFRISYPQLTEPKQYNNQGKARFTVSAIFNVGNPKLPCLIDPTLLNKSIALTCQVNKVSIKSGNPFSLGIKENSSGEPIDGYHEHSMWGTFTKYPKTDKSTVPCYGPKGEQINPDEVIAGYYGRAKIRFYKPRQWPTIAIALSNVQLIAVGETFSTEDLDTDMDEVEGADSIGGNDLDHVDFSIED
jgi:hypothetical protein